MTEHDSKGPRKYPKTCERCHQLFECGLSRCWCGQVPVTDQMYDRIVEQYHDCLCPRCLAELTSSPLPSSTPEFLR